MSFRTRTTSLLAGGLVALSLTGAPAMAAEPSADDPVATVNLLIDTILAKDFQGIGPLVCAEKREELVGQLDITQAFGALPPGIDPQVLADSIILSAPTRAVTLVSNDGATAVVDVTFSLAVTLEEEGARMLITGLLESQGMEVTDEMVAMFLPQLMAQFESMTQDLSDQADVILEEGAWRVCDDLSMDSPSASPSPAGSPGLTPSAVAPMPSPSPAA